MSSPTGRNHDVRIERCCRGFPPDRTEYLTTQGSQYPPLIPSLACFFERPDDLEQMESAKGRGRKPPLLSVQLGSSKPPLVKSRARTLGPHRLPTYPILAAPYRLSSLLKRAGAALLPLPAADLEFHTQDKSPARPLGRHPPTYRHLINGTPAPKAVHTPSSSGTTWLNDVVRGLAQFQS